MFLIKLLFLSFKLLIFLIFNCFVLLFYSFFIYCYLRILVIMFILELFLFFFKMLFFIYGIVWKKDCIVDFVYEVIKVGFWGIDIVVMKWYYDEVFVGEGI